MQNDMRKERSEILTGNDLWCHFYLDLSLLDSRWLWRAWPLSR